MQADAVIGRTKIKLWDFEQDTNATTLYKVDSRQKIRNILVDCDYFESKATDTKAKSISFLVTIKVFGKHPSKPIHWFEMYGNTSIPKYNHINRCTKTKDFVLNDEDLNTFQRLLQVINGEFDEYTVRFIGCAKKLIENKGEITITPEFIKEAIDEVRTIRQNEKVININ